jgi:hypothetical protein
VHAAIRREGLPVFSASGMTVGELVSALQMAREVGDARLTVPAQAKPTGEPADPATADENVTSLSSARQIK